MWSYATLLLLSLVPLALSFNTPAKANVTKGRLVYNFARNFLGLDKCNACVGTSLCRKFFREEIRFEKWLSSDLKLPPIHKRAYSANYTYDIDSWRPVVISRIQSRSQNEISDQKICASASLGATCSIEKVLRSTERFQKWVKSDRLTPELVQGLSSPLLRCPTQRLLDRIVRRYAEVQDSGSVLMRGFTDRDKLRLLYTLSVSTHPIMLQLFPGAEGWPFPRYFGSCGRVFVTAWTTSIREFYNAPPDVTADIAYQLLRITHSLGYNDLDYFLYYTSVHSNMFGTFEDGRLYITDTSKIGIIDKQEVKENTREVPQDKDIFSCLTSGCETDLTPCGMVSEAQSLAMVCRDILPPLLAGKFSDSLSFQKRVDQSLRLCSDEIFPAKITIEASNQLMELLKSLRTCDPRFAYRYPECKYMESY